MADQTPQNPTPPAQAPASPKPSTPAPAPAAAPAPAPHRDKNGRLTRAGMEHAIRTGGSVMHNGVTISRIDQLPSEAELAQGDTAAEEAALAALDQRQAALDRERSLITSRNKGAAKK